jgi:hypothetical protein
MPPRRFEETRRRHEHIDRFRGARARGLRPIAITMRPVFTTRRVSRRRVRILTVSRTNQGRRRRRRGVRESEVQFRRAGPHALDARREAVNRGFVIVVKVCSGVGGSVGGGGAAAHEVCSRGVLGVVDGVADLASDVSEVATVALFGLRFAPFLDDPEEAKGDKGAGDEAREEAGGEGAAVEAGLRGDGCGGA